MQPYYYYSILILFLIPYFKSTVILFLSEISWANRNVHTTDLCSYLIHLKTKLLQIALNNTVIALKCVFVIYILE